MTLAAGVARPNDSPILHAAIAMASEIRAAAEEIERGRRLPPAISDAMKKAGFLAWRCRAHGVDRNWTHSISSV
jgi:hypothetical protein